eukprot:4767355-Pleurochrysis_carterae.AAC.1
MEDPLRQGSATRDVESWASRLLLCAFRFKMRAPRCVVSLQEVAMFQGLKATRMPESAATVAFQ